MTEVLVFPGPGGVKHGVIARPATVGIGVAVLGVADPGPLCDRLASSGFVAAAPPDDDDPVDTAAALIGFVAGASSTRDDKVVLLAAGDGVDLAVTIAPEIADLVPGVVVATDTAPASDGATVVVVVAPESLAPDADAGTWAALVDALRAVAA